MRQHPISIRAAQPDDLEDLLSLYQELNSDDDLLQPDLVGEKYAAILAHPGLTIFLALDNGERWQQPLLSSSPTSPVAADPMP